MIVSTRGSIFRVLLWQWRKVLLFTLSATATLTLHRLGGLDGFYLPSVPLVVVGAALGIFVSFRTNADYDRWWEGRKLWGRLVNSSRQFTDQVLSYLTAGERDVNDGQRRLVRRHAAYVHIIRCVLREQNWCDVPDVRRLLDRGTLAALARESNGAHAMLHWQHAELAELNDGGQLDNFRLQSFDRTLASLLDIQGGCERIKNTPMPRVYGFMAERMIVAYGLLFPLGVVADVGWLVVPLNVLVGLGFALISEAGRVLEDPFTTYFNGLPRSQLSTMIEINIRQRLGDTELPPPVEPKNGILM